MARRSARAIDLVRVVTAAYELGSDAQGWLGNLTEAVRPRFEGDFTAQAILAIRTQGGPEGELPYELIACSPSPDDAGVRLGVEAFRRIGREDGLEGVRLANELLLMSVSEVSRSRPAWSSIFLETTQKFGLAARDFVGISVESGGAMVSVGALTRQVSAPQARERAATLPLRGHLEAAVRLRQRLGWVPMPEKTPVECLYRSPHAEAIFTEGGAFVEGKSAALEGRMSLADGVRQLKSARDAQKRSAPDDAQVLWDALVQGRWSLVERLDSDGKKFILAYRNEAESPDPRALKAGEQAALKLLLGGCSNRQVAAVLGISEPSVSQRLRAVALKLGARSPTELMDVGRRILEQQADAFSVGLGGDVMALEVADSHARPLGGGLTDCECNVIELVMAGYSRAEIAKRRGVALQTVNNQLASAYRRLGVETRTELVDRVHDLRTVV